MLGAIPLLDGATYSFDVYYRRSFAQIAKAAGHHILFYRTGNPRFSDALYMEMRTPIQAKEDRRLRRQWEKDFSTPEAEEHQRIGQSLSWIEQYDLTPQDLPCFVFVTQDGRRVGILRLADCWYETESAWRVFVRRLCLWLTRKAVKEVATADLEDGVVSRRLSRLLRKLTQEVDSHLQLPEGMSQMVVGGHTRPNVYCQVITGKGRENLTRAKYERLVAQKHTCDMFINGMSRQVSRRDSKGNSRSSELTPRELEILMEYIESREAKRPRDTRAGRQCSSLQTANRLFEGARWKVDTSVTRYKYRAFVLIRHPQGSEGRKYRFDPPLSLDYRVIVSP